MRETLDLAPTASMTSPLHVTGVLDPSSSLTELRLSSGEVVTLPTALFLEYLGSTSALSSESVSHPGDAHTATEGTVIPLIAEQLEIGKRVVETGVVRLSKQVEEHTETVDVPLSRTVWEIERVPVDQVVFEQPPVRVEGETTIYPVLEERAVLSRQLLLREEVRVTRRVTVTHNPETVSLRRETLNEERHQL